ncbi:MAG: hypothetical protein Kow00120_13180 [Anaerolineae bacterium]
MPQYPLTEKQKRLLRLVAPGLEDGTIRGRFFAFGLIGHEGLDIEMEPGNLWKHELVEQDDIDVFVHNGFIFPKGKEGYTFNRQEIINAVANNFEMPAQATGGMAINVHGNVGPGAVVGSGSVHAHTIVGGDLIQGIPGADQAQKDELAELIAQLNQMLKQAPAAHVEEAEAVAATAESLLAEAGKDKPNKTLLRVTSDGLKAAAENLEAVVPGVVRIAVSIVSAILGLGK